MRSMLAFTVLALVALLALSILQTERAYDLQRQRLSNKRLSSGTGLLPVSRRFQLALREQTAAGYMPQRVPPSISRKFRIPDHRRE